MKGEAIGKKMEVVKSRNKEIVGIRGTVVDETKETFKVETNTGRKTILKRGSTFNINGKIVKGDDIAVRPEDRVKQ